MKAASLRALPKVRDSWSYVYVDKGRIETDSYGVIVRDERGHVPIPCAMLTLLMLGPGTSITHAAVRSLAEAGCLITWTGEDAVRFYALGLGETRSSRNLLRQVAAYSDPMTRMAVVRRMYEARFTEPTPDDFTLKQIRGLEGVRVRQAYADASRETGIRWRGRAYDRRDWSRADPVNRALSTANACLYGVCLSAIVSTGYSPAIGFIHTGKTLSFVYDIADLYKTELAIPVAFRQAAEGSTDLERRVRRACRDAYASARLLSRIVDDVSFLITGESRTEAEEEAGSVVSLWDTDGVVEGGTNYADEETP